MSIVGSCRTFGFANSQGSHSSAKCQLTFGGNPLLRTESAIIEEGSVAMLFSLPQMVNLGVQLSAVLHYGTAENEGERMFLKMLTSKHLVLDLLDS
eukprot:5654190-Amphidinium_carterae.1